MISVGDRVMLNLGRGFHYHGATGTVRKIEREGKDIFVQWDGCQGWEYVLHHHWLKPIGPDYPSMTMAEASERHMTEWKKSRQ